MSPTLLAAIISADETLSRFILSSGHFSKVTKRVKAEAFMPNRDGEVSVFRVSDLDEPEICAIGDAVAKVVARNLHGRAELKARVVRHNDLDVVSAEPPVRHANIVGWPEKDKARQKIIALQLATSATLLLR